MPSVLDQLLDETVTKIKALTLTGLATTTAVKRLKCVLDRDFPTPGIGVSVLGPEEITETGPNQKDDVIYNILVAIKVADNQDQTANSDGETQFLWRQKIRRRFSHQPGGTFPFSAVTEAVACSVKPLNVIDEQIWAADNLLVSALVLRVQCREGRSYS